MCGGASSCLCLDHTMEGIFFKSETERPFRVWTIPDGKINYGDLGLSKGLEPGSITLCGDRFPTIDHLSCATWTEIKNVLRVAETNKDPVVVSGRPTIPVVPTVPTGMLLNCLFYQLLIAPQYSKLSAQILL